MTEKPDAGRPPAEGVPSDVAGLQRLLDISRRINAEVRPDAILEAIVDSLVSLTGADRGFLMLRQDDGDLEFAIARDKQGQPLEEQRFRVSRGVVDEVARTGQTRLIDDAASSDAYQTRRSVIRLSLRTILCTPLATARGVLGVIYVDSNAITRRFTAGDVPLVEAFAAQAAAALERVRLQQAERDRDRMLDQLAVASEIQRTFLPSTFPDLPGIAGAVATVPAHAVGGDLYDVIPLPEGRVGIVVGDVAGKGVPGALFGARLLSDLRYEALLHGDVAGTLSAANAIVAGRATRGMFVTALYAVLDPARREVTYGNAGHLAPLVRPPEGSPATWSRPLDVPLGILPDVAYTSETRTLEPGETLLLLTDGITDAEGADGERFDVARLVQAVTAAPPDPAGLVEFLLDTVAIFTGQRPQADDQTLLAVAFR